MLVDASVRHITYWTPIPLILAYVPGQATFYKKWLKANKTAALIDQNVAGAQIHWLGPKKTEYVILYFHGESVLQELSRRAKCAKQFYAMA